MLPLVEPEFELGIISSVELAATAIIRNNLLRTGTIKKLRQTAKVVLPRSSKKILT